MSDSTQAIKTDWQMIADEEDSYYMIRVGRFREARVRIIVLIGLLVFSVNSQNCSDRPWAKRDSCPSTTSTTTTTTTLAIQSAMIMLVVTETVILINLKKWLQCTML